MEFGIDVDVNGPNRAVSLPNPFDGIPFADLVTAQVEFSATDGGMDAVQGVSVVVGPSLGVGSIQNAREFDYLTIRDLADFVGDFFAAPTPTASDALGSALFGGAGGGFVLYPSKPNLNGAARAYRKRS